VRHKPEDGCFIAHQHQQHQLQAAQNTTDTTTTTNHHNHHQHHEDDLSSLQTLIREVEVLRDSADHRMDEVTLCNRRLEQEVRSAREAAAALDERNRALKREQAGTRRGMEEARQAVLSGLAKVKQLEAQAGHVPALQRHVLQLEAELCYYR